LERTTKMNILVQLPFCNNKGEHKISQTEIHVSNVVWKFCFSRSVIVYKILVPFPHGHIMIAVLLGILLFRSRKEEEGNWKYKYI
jgi:hypothetical protein